MFRHLPYFVCLLSLCSACGPEYGSAAADLTLGAADRALVVAFVNDPQTTQDLLDADVGLDSRAAENIIAHRNGADGVTPSADDDLFDDFAELDAVSYVGPSALTKLRDYAAAHAPAQPETVEGVTFSAHEAALVVWGVNQATVAELDDDVGLDKRAAENLVAGAPFASVAQMGPLGYVGPSALKKLRGHVPQWLLEQQGAPPLVEVGVVSDLDKTVVPPATPDLSQAPYPGVSTLYQILEHRHDGAPGDLYFVTAREPADVVDIPDYLEQHHVPAGPIATGVSGFPWLARPEKVKDISAVLDATGAQKFILFGDSSHVDPEVSQDILALYPERILAVFIHKVNATVSPNRVEGLNLHESYAEVAALLYGYGAISRDEALSVMIAARDEGLPLTLAEMDAMLDANAP